MGGLISQPIFLNKVTSVPFSSEATKTISGLRPTKKYLIRFNLLQNTSNGLIAYRFNADSGANYSFAGYVFAAAGAPDVNAAGTLIPLSYSGGIVTAGLTLFGRIEFKTTPTDSRKVNSLNEANYSGGLEIIGAYYNGAADLTSITIFTSAGTLTGVVDLYEVL